MSEMADGGRPPAVDLQVVGGGLAGLIAANRALDQGLSVRLIEKQRTVGGRATSAVHNGFTLNQGPHALYLDGELNAALGQFGVPATGSPPGLAGAAASIGSKRGLLPGGPGSLLRTTLLSAGGKAQFARFAARLPRTNPELLASTSVDDWLDSVATSPGLRSLLWGLINLSTYNAASDLASADAAVAQLKMALSTGVHYVDGGWQSIVDKLDQRLQNHRAARFERVVDNVTAIAQSAEDEGLIECRTAGGASWFGSTVIIAAGHALVAQRLTANLVPPSDLVSLSNADLTAKAGPPVQAAAMDLGLSVQPPTDVYLGLDRGLYLTNQSKAAAVSRRQRSLVALARYIRPGDELTADENRALLLEHAWASGISRASVVMERYLHRLTVTGGMPMASTGGMAGRPGVSALGHPGVFLAGDWVGDRGLLADAAAASAFDAVDAVAKRLGAVYRPADPGALR